MFIVRRLVLLNRTLINALYYYNTRMPILTLTRQNWRYTFFIGRPIWNQSNQSPGYLRLNEIKLVMQSNSTLQTDWGIQNESCDLIILVSTKYNKYYFRLLYASYHRVKQMSPSSDASLIYNMWKANQYSLCIVKENCVYPTVVQVHVPLSRDMYSNKVVFSFCG